MSLFISSSTNGVPESSWRVLLLVYHGVLNTILSIFDCTLCMMFVLDGLAQPPELYTVRTYGLKDSFIHKQLVFSGQLRFSSDKPIHLS